MMVSIRVVLETKASTLRKCEEMVNLKIDPRAMEPWLDRIFHNVMKLAYAKDVGL